MRPVLAAALFALPLLAGLATAAQAQTERALVSNVGQSSDGTLFLGARDYAQRFTTGSDSAGYTVSSVDVFFTVGDISDTTGLSVTIRNDSNGSPGTVIGTLTNPTFTADVTQTFRLTAPGMGISLAANTRYHITFRITDGSSPSGFGPVRTESRNEDAGAAAGWSIADHYRHSLRNNPGWSINASFSAKIRINTTAASDTTAPVLSTAAVNGASLVLTYDEPLDGTSAPAAGAFTVTVAGAARTVSSVAVSGSAVTLTLASVVTPGQTVTLGYAVPTSNPIQDAAGNDAAALTNQAVTNSTGDTTAPVFSTATVNGSALTLTYNEALSTAAPAASAFTVMVAGTARTVSAVAVSGSAVTLTLSSAVTSGQTVTLSYAVPAINPVQDLAGNDAAALTNHVVTNNTALVLSTATVNGRSLTLRYDSSLDSTSTPAAAAFTVTVASLERTVSSVTVSGSAVTLTLSSAVRSGHTVTVSYTVPNANPIQDAVGNDAAALTNHVVTNNTASVLSTATVNGRSLTLRYDSSLDSTSTPAAAAFTVTVAGAERTVSRLSVSGTSVNLLLSSAVTSGQTVTVSYTVPNTNPIQDLAGNDAAALTNQAVTNSTAPVLSTATVNGATLVLTYDGALDTSSVPAAGAFTVMVAGSARTVSAVAISGSAVTLTLSPAVTHGQAVTVSYAVPATNPIQDAGGNDAAALTNQAVTNNTPATAGVTLSPASLALTELHASDAEDDYTVVLDTDPGDGVTVTVTPTSGDATAATVSPASLSFSGGSSGDWGTAKAVTVTAVNDADAVGETFNITHAVTAPVGNDYRSVAAGNVAVTVTDAGHGVVVSPTTVSVRENGGTATYGIRLQSAPGGTVAVTPTSSDATHATVSGAVSFDNSDWSTAKTVTVTAAGAATDTATITHAVTTVTTAYPSTLTVDPVGVTVTAAPANNAPAFPNATYSRSIAENTAANANVGAAIPAATDADNDSLTYTMGGADVGSFNFNVGTRQITTRSGIVYDFEADASYTVTVTADDSNGGTAVTTVTITLTDEAEPPAAPNAPTVTAASTTSLSVSWTAPANAGKPDIASYDLQYRVGNSGNFTAGPQNVTGTSTTIAGLTASTAYEVQVRATNAEGDGPWSASGSGSTQDPGTITVSPTALSLIEGNPAKGYTVVLGSDPGAAVAVTATSNDGAAQVSTGGAFGSSVTLNFTHGNTGNWGTAQTVEVRATPNDGDTADESVSISHASAVASNSNNRFHGVTIDPVSVAVTDADGLPVVQFNPSSFSVQEDAGTATVTVSKTGTAAAEVGYATSDNTATAPADYTATSGVLTWAANDTADKTFTVPIVDDSAAEGTESFQIRLSAPADSMPPTLLGSPRIAVTSILDNETMAELTVTGFGSTARVLEDRTVSFGATLSRNPNDVVTIPVRVKSSSGVGAGEVSLPASLSFSTATASVDVGILADHLVETDETLVVEVHDLPDGITLASGTSGEDSIVVEDVTNIRLAAPPAGAVTEGSTRTLTVELSENAPSGGVSVPVVLQSASTAAAADVMLPTVAVTAGASTGTGTFTAVDDNLHEGAERAVLAVGAVNGYTTAQTERPVDITDNDAAPTMVTLSLAPATVSEGDGSTAVTVTATVGGATRWAGAQTVRVSVAGSGGASVVGFTAVADFDLTIPAGADSGTADFNLVPTDDATETGDETVTVSGTLTSVTVSSADLTLTDDDGTADVPEVTIAAGASPVTEGTGATFTVTANPVPTADLTVNLTVADAPNGNFVASSNENAQTVTVTSSGTATYTVDTVADAVDEPSGPVTVTVAASAANPATYTIGTADAATVTAMDNDRTTVTLARSGSSAITENGTVTVTVTLGRNLVAGETVTAPLAVSGAGITAADYTLTAATGANLNAGVSLVTTAPHSAAAPAVVFTGHDVNTVQTATLTLTAQDDDVDEGASETLTLSFGTGVRAVTSNLDRATGTGTGGTTPTGTASVPITDNDSALCSTGSTAVTATNPDDPDGLARDCAILLGARATLEGSSPTIPLVNWVATGSMAGWTGVTLVDDRVAEIVLPRGQGLHGTIPDLSGLTGLTLLRIVGSETRKLTGGFPTLPADLEQLDLGGNALSGTIPDLTGYASLTLLELDGNAFTGSVPALPASIRTVNIADNALSGAIPGLGGLTSLATLNLGGNGLTGGMPALPASLVELRLNDNELSGTIPALSGLTSLQVLDLNRNGFSGALPALPTTIQRLGIRDNGLSGPIPDLSAPSLLLTIDLRGNALTGAVPAASALPALVFRLLLHGNELTGAIPDLSGLTGLATLWLGDNGLTGAVPTASALPASLVSLQLQGNSLSGTVPDLSSRTGLTHLDLQRNALTGALPTAWPASLLTLHLAGNPVTGEIPSQLGSLTSLTELSLCGTNLDTTATLPTALTTRQSAGTLAVSSCVSVADASATEGTALGFSVERSTFPVRGAVGAAGLTLMYATADGTAGAADYTGTSAGSPGSVTIPGNTTTTTWTSSATISVATATDSAAEGDETMSVTADRTAVRRDRDTHDRHRERSRTWRRRSTAPRCSTAPRRAGASRRTRRRTRSSARPFRRPRTPTATP